MKKLLSILFVILRFTLPLTAIDDIQLHLKMISQEKAQSPEFYFDQILFTVKPEADTRFVGIAFSHEAFNEIHHFQKNENGVYFLLMEIPGEAYLDYRLIVDGIWQQDPMAEQQISGLNSIVYSRLNIPEHLRKEELTPLVHPNGLVEFSLREEPGSVVYLAGDFNQWDPYMLPMSEISPGHFKIEIRLTPGQHFYNFFIDGKGVTDPSNRQILLNQFGEARSVLYIP